MTGIYILLALCIVLGIGAIVVGVLALKKKSNGGGVTLEEVRAENERLRAELDKSIGMSLSMTAGALNAQVQNTKDLTAKVDALQISTVNALGETKLSTERNINELKASTANSVAEMKLYVAESLQAVQKTTADSLKEVKEDNQKQLEKMRETVDEKLSSTLKERFEQSFLGVSTRLEELGRSVVELQSLQAGVNDLNKILINVKTRGTWGEVSLDTLLSQILTENQYEKQYPINPRIKKDGPRVDFAVKMPGKGEGEVVIPIDAKFPLDDYMRLVDASEKGNVADVQKFSKALEDAIEDQAKSISKKYILVPRTTDFAIMYLPTEGLYAEVMRNRILVEKVRNLKIMVCGPTTITALLNSLQMGFNTVQIEKSSAEIIKVFRQFQKDFGTYVELLQKTGRTLEQAQKTIGDAESKTKNIQNKLSKVVVPDDTNVQKALTGDVESGEGGDDET